VGLQVGLSSNDNGDNTFSAQIYDRSLYAVCSGPVLYNVCQKIERYVAFVTIPSFVIV